MDTLNISVSQIWNEHLEHNKDIFALNNPQKATVSVKITQLQGKMCLSFFFWNGTRALGVVEDIRH